MATIQTINSWFETGDIPTQEQFQQTFSSFRHKDNLVPILEVEGLDLALQNKLGTNHTADANAHNTVLAKLDASNLNYENTEAWRLALGVGDIPDNVALVDVGEPQEVFNKEQITTLYMAISDYVLGGKIRADKIEALGLTELVSADETSLDDFLVNSGNYVFEKNDFIAIAINGNYSLYLFKGGDKSVSANYLPTGLTNITISMVEDLQASLDSKMGKIYGTEGSFFLQVDNNGTNFWRSIIPSVNYLLFWNGSQFINSNAYFLNNKIGIGTTTPSEQLHLTARARMLALVLEDTAETLPQQITYNNRKFWGTDSTGTKKQFMYSDFADYRDLWQKLTDTQKTEIKTIANGGWTTNTMSVFLINPLVINRSVAINQYVSLLGSNLNFLSTNFSVEIMDSTGLIVVALVPNSNVQLQSDGLSLVFHYNFNTIPAGNYKIRLNNGVALYVTQVTFELRDTVDAYDLTNLIWTKKVYNDLKLPLFNSSPTSLSFNGDMKNLDDTDFDENSISANITTVSAVSTAIGSMTDDFVLELSLNNPTTYIYAYTSFGITVNGTENLIDDLLAKAVIGGWRIAAIGDGTTIIDANNSNSDRLLIVKRGQLMQYVIVGKTQSFSKIINVTNANVPFYLKMVRQNGGLTNGANTSISTGLILSAYKLN